MPTKPEVIEVAQQCFDPEIPVNIWDLGLIYDVDAKDDEINIKMTLTTQHCPAAQQIPEDLKTKLKEKFGLEKINIELVWEPTWTPERITEAGKAKLGIETDE